MRFQGYTCMFMSCGVIGNVADITTLCSLYVWLCLLRPTGDSLGLGAACREDPKKDSASR